MKNHLLLFLAPALLLTACGSSDPAPAASSGTDQSVPSTSQEVDSSGGSSAASEDFDPSTVQDNLIIHYHRLDDKYDDYALWLWDHGNGGDGAEYLPNASDSYGSVFHYPLSTWAASDFDKLDLGIIVKSKGSWSEKDPEQDRFIVTADLTADEHGNYSVWLWTGIAAIYDKLPSAPYYVSSATFTSFNKIKVASGYGAFTKVELYVDDVLKQTFGPYEAAKETVTLDLEEPATLTHSYSLVVTYTEDCAIVAPVDVNVLYETDEFGKEFNYDGELGAIYTPEKTTFKVWSPYSDAIDVRIYDNGTPKALDAEKGDDTFVSYFMMKGEKGVWSVDVIGDLEGKYYTYKVKNYKYDKEIIDPYAKSAGINGVRGMIVDFDKTNPIGWDDFETAHPYDPMSLTVYETHVEDVTSHQTWAGTAEYRGKFLGMAEEGTTLPDDDDVTTGFDHIKELGVNAVQLQPMFDHANDERPDKYQFNWGYNPLNYNVVEGAYSTDPYDGYARIREFKSLVAAYHKAGINVIMDVVYNHVDSVSGRSFDVLAPGYYFRYVDGSLSNGSGCGNETASNHYMFHKFMVDSTAFWAKEYKLGGFRFDLMELHDLDTMDDLTANLREINPFIAVYGEPWAGGSSPLPANDRASQANGKLFKGYGQFNDQMRDALVRSGMKGKDEVGYGYDMWSPKSSIGDAAKIRDGLKGLTYNVVLDSKKTVNYVTCHDNYTINDRILAYEYYKTHDGKTGKELPVPEGQMPMVKTTVQDREKMNLFSQSFALLSQGTSFFLAGEEMLRSKYEQIPETVSELERMEYAHNSYNTTDKIDGAVVNALDYSRKTEFPKLFENYKKMIELKQTVEGLHQDIHYYGKDDDNRGLVDVSYNKKYNQITSVFRSADLEYKMVFNAGVGELDPIDFDGYDLVLDTTGNLGGLNAETPMTHFSVVVGSKALVD